MRQVEDIGRMVDEFSAFARMPQPVMRPEDPAQVAREALVLQQNAHHDIVFSTDIPPGLPRIQCDRRLLGQALTNLLANAADAVHGRQQAQEAAGETVEPGHIRILVERGQDSLSIAVEDDGTGLPQGEERERITEPYVTHKPKGTGLGLAIVKKIMEDHGGRLVLTDRDGE
ncbi:sensor histidine kinase [Pseudoroseomonas wenyumeiae]